MGNQCKVGSKEKPTKVQPPQTVSLSLPFKKRSEASGWVGVEGETQLLVQQCAEGGGAVFV
jgi:hypothetical protein